MTAMYETEAWSRGIQLDEREDWFERTSLATVVIWDSSGRIVRTMSADARTRREAAAVVKWTREHRGFEWSWSECDWYDLHPEVDVPGSMPLPAELGVGQVWDAIMGMPRWFEGSEYDEIRGLEDGLLVEDDGAVLHAAGWPGAFQPLDGLAYLTEPDRTPFTWEPVRDAWETSHAEAEARWVEARAVAGSMLVSEIEALMMEVPD